MRNSKVFLLLIAATLLSIASPASDKPTVPTNHAEEKPAKDAKRETNATSGVEIVGSMRSYKSDRGESITYLLTATGRINIDKDSLPLLIDHLEDRSQLYLQGEFLPDGKDENGQPVQNFKIGKVKEILSLERVLQSGKTPGLYGLRFSSAVPRAKALELKSKLARLLRTPEYLLNVESGDPVESILLMTAYSFASTKDVLRRSGLLKDIPYEVLEAGLR